ncbi:hypothetical protein [Kitasatospora paranensis]|uniref:Integral membrane protein n=1 Tax=Kitasatospora paranensis TaxID=258053 RepID=A0ABW2FRG3_9ACTN
MHAFAWICLTAVWALTLTTALPALVRGRLPRQWGGKGDARLLGTGQLVIAVGVTWGIATTGTPGAVHWVIGPGLVLVGIGLTAWAGRRTGADRPQ